MYTFEDLEFSSPKGFPETMPLSCYMPFNNGYGVSVVTSSEPGLYNVAVIGKDGSIYDTPLTPSRLIGATAERVTERMLEIQNL